MLESKIQKSIIDYLKKEGWFTLKIIVANRNGIPDLMCIKDGRVVFFEVKQPGKKVNQKGLQQYMMEELIRKGVEAYEVHSVNEVKEIIVLE